MTEKEMIINALKRKDFKYKEEGSSIIIERGYEYFFVEIAFNQKGELVEKNMKILRKYFSNSTLLSCGGIFEST